MAEQYDYNKLILFCLLFSDETPANKVTCLFYLMADDQYLITAKNGQVKTIIAMLTIISCMIPAIIAVMQQVTTTRQRQIRSRRS